MLVPDEQRLGRVSVDMGTEASRRFALVGAPSSDTANTQHDAVVCRTSGAAGSASAGDACAFLFPHKGETHYACLESEPIEGGWCINQRGDKGRCLSCPV